MTSKLFIPMFVQVVLTFILVVRMGFLRFSALKSGKLKIKDIALGQNAWPESLAQATNSFHNQLEMPIFFFVAVLCAIVTKQESNIFLGLAWGYSSFRLIHAYIHNTSNNVRFRFLAFLISNVTLLMMWISLFRNNFSN